MGEKGITRSPAAVIIFSFITCGIYALYWLYKFASELKAFLGKDEISPGVDVLLCIICFPYSIYWAYKYGKFLGEAQAKAGLTVGNDDAILYLILALFGLHVVFMAIMQSNANKIWEKQV